MSKVKHLSHKFTVSFDLKTVVEREKAEQTIQELLAAHKQFQAEGGKVSRQSVFVGLIAETYENKGLDAAVAEVIRFNMREALKDEIGCLFAGTEISSTSPIKIQLKRD